MARYEAESIQARREPLPGRASLRTLNLAVCPLESASGSYLDGALRHLSQGTEALAFVTPGLKTRHPSLAGAPFA